nr:uncharacterized protein LOC113829484 isoform X2 [Penaeus vannamei]
MLHRMSLQPMPLQLISLQPMPLQLMSLQPMQLHRMLPQPMQLHRMSPQPMQLRLIPQQRVPRLKQPQVTLPQLAPQPQVTLPQLAPQPQVTATTGSTTTGDSATTGSTTTGDSATTGSTTTGDSATTGSTTSAPSTTPPQDRIDAEDLLTRYIQFLSDATAPVDDENADQIDSGTVSANSFIEEFDDLIDLIAQTGKRITDGTRALLPRARGDTQQLLDRINNGRIAIREEVERLNPLAENTITLPTLAP